MGEGVDAGWIGKPVATVPGFSQNRYGTLGEEAVVPVEVLGEYPANLTPVQAAAIWMQFLTAYGALVLVGDIKAGDFVSIPAASSSVGLAAIQIVRDHGATAIAVTRSAVKREELLALGAHHVIVSENENYPARIKEITSGKGARITFDPVAGPGIEQLAEGAANGGHLIEYGALAGEPTPFPIMAAMAKGLNVHGYTMLQVTHDPGCCGQGEKICLRPIGRRALCAQNCPHVSLRADDRGLPVPGIKSAGGQGGHHSPVRQASGRRCYAIACGRAACSASSLLPMSAAAAASTRW